MVVEFIGGSLNNQQKTVERLYEYINNNGELYYAHAIHYESLKWVYVWYELSGYYINA